MPHLAFRLAVAVSFVCFSGQAIADTISDAIIAWSEEMRAAEAAAPTHHPAVYNSQTATFYIAMFEAVNASTDTQRTTFSGVSLPTDARADLAASYAAHAALSDIYGGSVGAFDAQLAELIEGARAEEIAKAEAVGTAAYDAVLSRHGDATETFFLTAPDQFLPAPPPEIESAEYAKSYNQVKSLGGADSTERTAEQSDIAAFWSDNRTGAMATHTWNAEKILVSQDLEGAELAQSMALFTGGFHDAILSVSASKAVYKTDRPIAAIHKGDDDGNPLTEGDATWLMFGNNTPPESLSYSYASGGGTIGSYFSNLLTHLIGTDEVGFEYSYLHDPNNIRSFERLSDMTMELGLSRIYNGEHFWHDVEAGWLMSKKIADYVHANALTKVGQ